MCIILLGWRAHPRYRLVVAANRDEYFRRPTAAAAFWEDRSRILAGRDLEAGGTWLGITPGGRFAALTNYRADRKSDAPSRGKLVSGFLAGNAAPGDYLDAIAPRAGAYNGFSLLVGDAKSLLFLSNRGNGPTHVAPGVHGLSNHLLDTPWPKVEKGKAGLAALLKTAFDPQAALALLDDSGRAPNDLLPSTGVSLEIEERLSAIRIPALGGYGTRSSTVLCIGERGEVDFRERSYREDGSVSGMVSFRFSLQQSGRPDPASSRRAGSRPRKISLPAR